KFERNMTKIRSAQSEACQNSDICVLAPEEFGHCCDEYSTSAKIDGKTKLLRASDGIHMALEGYHLYIKEVFALLSSENG
ncbi:MAG TPA: hypothetical protein VIY47_08930, partial [Ignavibacteriaceae bacterium]